MPAFRADPQGWISDIQCLGAPPTIGLVEALLLLAENLPRDPARTGSLDDDPDEIHAIGFGEEVHGAENRQAWMLIGMAIRSSYGLGIDKVSSAPDPADISLRQKCFPTPSALSNWNEQGWLGHVSDSRGTADADCYLFDRHVSLRLGKAFWSRGPSICFQGFSASAQTGPTAAPGNFPFLREIKSGDSPQEDFASLVQAYVELTQMMSNAHDILYPNAARTRSLVLYVQVVVVGSHQIRRVFQISRRGGAFPRRIQGALAKEEVSKCLNCAYPGGPFSR